MIKYIHADAIEYAKENGGYILHVCNNKGVMGSGIAKAIKEACPQAYDNYREYGYKLGTTSWGYTEDFGVCNMVAQDSYRGYRGDHTNKRYLNYAALTKCLQEVCRLPDCSDIIIPFLMGADRAGGDWEVVLELVEGILDNHNITVCYIVEKQYRRYNNL